MPAATNNSLTTKQSSQTFNVDISLDMRGARKVEMCNLVLRDTLDTVVTLSW